MDSQFLIKLLLAISFVGLAVLLFAPMRGTRNQAIRTLVIALAVVFTVFAIFFPQVVNSLANFVGVGRGTDFILYILVIFVIANAISSSRRNRNLERQITLITRQIALDSVDKGSASKPNT